MKDELLIGLSEEQISKVRACTSQDQILKLAKEEGIELTNEQLEAVSGGCETTYKKNAYVPDSICPKCGAKTGGRTYGGFYKYTCFHHSPSFDWTVPIN